MLYGNTQLCMYKLTIKLYYISICIYSIFVPRHYLIANLQCVQNYAMRLILKLPPRTSSHCCFRALNWINLFQQHCVFVVYQVHRCVLKVAPAYLLSKFSSNLSFGYGSTRGRDKLHLFRPQTDFGKNTLQFRGAQLYNGLPSSVRALQNLTAFRCACVAHFLVS